MSREEKFMAFAVVLYAATVAGSIGLASMELLLFQPLLIMAEMVFGAYGGYQIGSSRW